MKEKEAVRLQYGTPENLNIRIGIHKKYSINKQGFHNWLIENYRISPGMHILELGCGNGISWREHREQLAGCGRVILSDLSEGMLEEARKNIGEMERLSYEIADIQNLPFAGESFDIVIANMMLYHVPDIAKALSEVKRVLKKKGTFYAATFGENGILTWLHRVLNSGESPAYPFSLQNGEEILKKYFAQVEKREYPDALRIDCRRDLIAYILSSREMTTLGKYSEAQLEAILQKEEKNGVIEIPKEYGIFLARKD